MNQLIKASAAGFFTLKDYNSNSVVSRLRANFAVRHYQKTTMQKVCFVGFLFSVFNYLGSIVNLHEKSISQHHDAVDMLNRRYDALMESITGEKRKKPIKQGDARVTPEVQAGIDLFNRLFRKHK